MGLATPSHLSRASDRPLLGAARRAIPPIHAAACAPIGCGHGYFKLIAPQRSGRCASIAHDLIRMSEERCRSALGTTSARVISFSTFPISSWPMGRRSRHPTVFSTWTTRHHGIRGWLSSAIPGPTCPPRDQLICYVPAALRDFVQRGIDVNPEGCILWLRHAPTTFGVVGHLRHLLALGEPLS